jgi:hypothetical protein
MAPPSAFGREFEFRLTARTYFVVFSPGQCIWLVGAVRNAFAVRPVQNDAIRVRRTPNIQDEAVRVRRYPGQIPQIVIIEPDHSPRLSRPLGFPQLVAGDARQGQRASPSATHLLRFGSAIPFWSGDERDALANQRQRGPYRYRREQA